MGVGIKITRAGMTQGRISQGYKAAEIQNRMQPSCKITTTTALEHMLPQIRVHNRMKRDQGLITISFFSEDDHRGQKLNPPNLKYQLQKSQKRIHTI